jgi:Ion channel
MMNITAQPDRNEVAPFEDAALTAMLAVQCFALFFAAPFGALGHPFMRSVADLLLVAYVLLVLFVTRNRKIGLLAMAVSGCGLASGIISMLVTSSSIDLVALVAHTISVIAFIVLGYVVAQAVFAPGPVNTHRVLGAIVLYLNLVLLFSTMYRLILDIEPEAFSGLSDTAEGPRGFAALIYFSFVTLTSTGYGDILAVNPFARSLANLESVVGQLYPATLLARLVAQHLQGLGR